MRFAILSDVHANLEALDAVLERCASLDADRIVCLGDLVGYGADPEPCAARLLGVAHPVLAGNHDLAAVGKQDTRFFNAAALAAIRWTTGRLSTGTRRALGELPLTAEMEGGLFAHASPESPQTWPYLFTPFEGREALEAVEAAMCFVGHSHCAFVCSTGNLSRTAEGTVTMRSSERYLVNVGSVGQPRDQDPRAAFAIWEPEDRRVSIHRVDYDIGTAQRKIREAGLPDLLAERLALGV